jgi:hypothetical protein
MGKKIGTQIAKEVGTNVLGRAIGRFVPYLGLFMIMYDVNTAIMNKTFEMTPVDEREDLLNSFGIAF